MCKVIVDSLGKLKEIYLIIFFSSEVFFLVVRDLWLC